MKEGTSSESPSGEIKVREVLIRVTFLILSW